MLNRLSEKLLRAGVLVIALLAAVGLAGCRQSAGGVPVDQSGREDTTGVQITLAADSDQIVMGPMVWRVTLRDDDGQPIEDAAVSVRGDMNHAGMVPVESAANHSGDGVYTADFEWTMAGDWIVTVTAELADGNVVSQTFDYSVRTR